MYVLMEMNVSKLAMKTDKNAYELLNIWESDRINYCDQDTIHLTSF